MASSDWLILGYYSSPFPGREADTFLQPAFGPKKTQLDQEEDRAVPSRCSPSLPPSEMSVRGKPIAMEALTHHPVAT